MERVRFANSLNSTFQPAASLQGILRMNGFFLRSCFVFAFLLGSCWPMTAIAEALTGKSKAPKFDFQSVCNVAEQRLLTPLNRRVYDLPCELVGLDYDSWRYIAYQVHSAIWRYDGLPYQVETGHRGYLFLHRVQLNEVNQGLAEELPFDPKAFEYRGWLNGFRFPRTLGHSGWKLVGKFNDERREAAKLGKEVFGREVASFLGSSYFRVLGSKHVYGSSARGLAIDCAMTHAEEFPLFTEYWFERPSKDAKQFRCWALLESERVVGAYQFDITPDINTTMDVRAKLYVRGKIGKLGLAPITSMWMWGGGTVPPEGDKRPEVHDADGLLIYGSDNSRLWRPLSRPSIPIVNHYSVPGLSAFGLVQRNRDAKRYGDSEALYHRRPTIIIEPKKAWPAGGVELLRLPAPHEGIDNVGAFYLLKDPPQEGESLEVEYRIHLCDDDKTFVPKTISTASHEHPRRARFVESNVCEVEPGVWQINLRAECKHTALGEMEESKLNADLIVLWNEFGRIVAQSVTKSPKGVEVSIRLQLEPDQASELLFRLRNGDDDLTEMWSYRCEPSSQLAREESTTLEP